MYENYFISLTHYSCLLNQHQKNSYSFTILKTLKNIHIKIYVYHLTHSFIHFSYIIIQGTSLHATVQKNLFQHFNHMLQEGKVYTIRNLKIDSANEKYKPLKGTIRGIFLLTTTLNKINDPNIIIPQH